MRQFDPGDKVIAFNWIPTNKWNPAKLVTEDAIVIEFRNGKVVVDSLFGEVEYEPHDIEFADVPF